MGPPLLAPSIKAPAMDGGCVCVCLCGCVGWKQGRRRGRRRRVWGLNFLFRAHIFPKIVLGKKSNHGYSCVQRASAKWFLFRFNAIKAKKIAVNVGESFPALFSPLLFRVYPHSTPLPEGSGRSLLRQKLMEGICKDSPIVLHIPPKFTKYFIPKFFITVLICL